MSGRLKFLLAVLVAGAGLSFWYAVGSSFTTIGDDGTASLLNQAVGSPACNDADSDGLCDFDETYWGTEFKNADSDGDGFKDGEEVLTGHNPAKAGPDDYLNDKRNLTQRTSALLLGGLITGDLKPESPQYQASVDALVDEIFSQYDANVATELDSLALSSGSLDNVITYGLRMSRTLGPLFAEISVNYRSVLATLQGTTFSNLPTLEKDNPAVYKAFVAAATAESGAFSARIADIKSVRVPPQMVTFHRALLTYLRGMQQRYDSLRTINRDPLMGIISLQVLQTLSSRTAAELIVSFNSQLTSVINSQ